MVTLKEVELCLYLLFLVGAMGFLIYLMFRMGSNKKYFQKESNSFFDTIVKEFPTLEKTDSHATYVNICGRYKGFPIFVSHARGKGGMPQRMRFYIHHDLRFENRVRMFDKKHRLLKAVQSGFNKSEATSLKGTEYLMYHKSSVEKVQPLFLEALDRLNPDHGMFALTCERLGLEFQCFGYVHERQPFINILDTLVTLIEKMGVKYPKIEPLDKERTEIALSDKKYSKITLLEDRFKMHSEKGVETYMKRSVLFIYETDKHLEIYIKSSKGDKKIGRGSDGIQYPDKTVHLGIDNVEAARILHRWLFTE